MLMEIFKSLTRYELTCKRKGEHTAVSEDLYDFVRNPKFTKETQCEDCGFKLQLVLDEHDSDLFWTREI